jgi:hypothetical protein
VGRWWLDPLCSLVGSTYSTGRCEKYWELGTCAGSVGIVRYNVGRGRRSALSFHCGRRRLILLVGMRDPRGQRLVASNDGNRLLIRALTYTDLIIGFLPFFSKKAGKFLQQSFGFFAEETIRRYHERWKCLFNNKNYSTTSSLGLEIITYRKSLFSRDDAGTLYIGSDFE